MTVFYLDAAFFINLVVDALLLIITALLGNETISRRRIALSAVCGGTYAVLTVFPQFALCTSIPFRLFMGWLMCVIAFGYESVVKSIKRFLLLLLAAAACAGCVCAVCFLSAGTGLTPHTEDPFADLAPKIVILSSVLVCVLLGFILKGRADGKEIKQTTIHAFGHTLTVRALTDTGNCLRDPLTNAPVLILRKAQALPLFSTPVREILETNDLSDAGEVLPVLHEAGYGRFFRLLPYRSVGVSGGLLLSFTAACTDRDSRASVNRCIALSEQPVSDGVSFDAIISI